MITLPLSRPLLEEARTRLRERGINLREDTGTFNSQGCVISYAYDGALLTVDVVLRPPWIPMQKIEQAIRDWFRSTEVR